MIYFIGGVIVGGILVAGYIFYIFNKGMNW